VRSGRARRRSASGGVSVREQCLESRGRAAAWGVTPSDEMGCRDGCRDGVSRWVSRWGVEMGCRDGARAAGEGGGRGRGAQGGTRRAWTTNIASHESRRLAVIWTALRLLLIIIKRLQPNKAKAHPTVWHTLTLAALTVAVSTGNHASGIQGACVAGSGQGTAARCTVRTQGTVCGAVRRSAAQ
jgi:hypothetical protein